MKRFLCVCIVGLLLPACGKTPPPQAAGKPIAHWLEAAKNTDPTVRTEAVIKLGNIGSTDSRALPALIGSLSDSAVAVRHAAIAALIKYGSSGRAAIPALSTVRDSDPDPALRELASKAVAHLQ